MQELTLLAFQEPAENAVADMWKLETIGICDSPWEDDDDRVLEQFNESVTVIDGPYHVSWPWKSKSSLLPSNFQIP